MALEIISPGDMWAGGASCYFELCESEFYHWDGDSWSPNLGLSGDRVVMGGALGYILHYTRP
jgi:hypothetical protein